MSMTTASGQQAFSAGGRCWTRRCTHTSEAGGGGSTQLGCFDTWGRLSCESSARLCLLALPALCQAPLPPGTLAACLCSGERTVQERCMHVVGVMLAVHVVVVMLAVHVGKPACCPKLSPWVPQLPPPGI